MGLPFLCVWMFLLWCWRVPLIMPWQGIGEASCPQQFLLDPGRVESDQVAPEGNRFEVKQPFKCADLLAKAEPPTHFSGGGTLLPDIDDRLFEDRTDQVV